MPTDSLDVPSGIVNDHANEITYVIEHRSGWRIFEWQELRDYRDLFSYLVWRHIRVQYAQSALGIGWAVIQPLFSMLIFTVIFGKLAGVSSDGAPYSVFSLAALVPWTYFANAVTEGTNSLVSNTSMLTKVYFPRLVLPLSAVVAKLVDFGIGLLILFSLMAWYSIAPNWNVLALPVLVLLMMLTAAGLAMWMTALAIQYRDVKYGLNFAIQLLMYATPVVYPASLIPSEWQVAYAVNPMVAVIECFRASLLGTQPMPWATLAMGTISALVIALTGSMYFRSKERLFADVA